MRPTPKDMKLWVDVIRFVKSGARGGALSFFTYMELSTSRRSLSSSFTDVTLTSRYSDLAPAVPYLPAGQIEVISVPWGTLFELCRRMLNIGLSG